MPDYMTPNFRLSQDAEKIRQPCSRIVQTLNVPQGYASGLHSLRPCWTGFLSILHRLAWCIECEGF